MDSYFFKIEELEIKAEKAMMEWAEETGVFDFMGMNDLLDVFSENFMDRWLWRWINQRYKATGVFDECSNEQLYKVIEDAA